MRPSARPLVGHQRVLFGLGESAPPSSWVALGTAGGLPWPVLVDGGGLSPLFQGVSPRVSAPGLEQERGLLAAGRLGAALPRTHPPCTPPCAPHPAYTHKQGECSLSLLRESSVLPVGPGQCVVRTPSRG